MLSALYSTSIMAQSPCPPSQISGIHIVQKDETLYGISRIYKVTVAQLRQWNGMSDKDVLQECVELSIGSSDNIPKSYNNAVVASKSVEEMPQNAGAYNYQYFKKSPYTPFFHVVSYNETLESISKIYGLSVGDIMMMNNFNGNTRLAAGQRLMLEDRNQTRQADYVFDEMPNTNRQATAQVMPTNYSNQSSRLKPQPTFDDEDTKVVVQSKSPQKQPAKPVEKPAPKPQATIPSSSNTSMSNEEMDMVKEINLVRGNPSGYITYIQEYIENLKKTGDMGNSISTAQELIAELKQTQRLSTLQSLQCVYTAAKKHGEDQKRRGDTDHQGSDGSWPWDRVKRECPDLQDGNENLVGGPANIRRAVILLLVDDGIEGRGHRKTMLNPDWKYVACYKMGTVGSMPNCWVQKYGY
jgi:LysM repeat protein